MGTLAIESNYCPVMQRESPRPGFLKARIMGGSGHLSNEQCAATVRRIAPRERVVLLHLSQECNEPAIAMGHHRRYIESGDDRACIVSGQFEPTPWVEVRGDGSSINITPAARHTQPGLFGRGGA